MRRLLVAIGVAVTSVLGAAAPSTGVGALVEHVEYTFPWYAPWFYLDTPESLTGLVPIEGLSTLVVPPTGTRRMQSGTYSFQGWLTGPSGQWWTEGVATSVEGGESQGFPAPPDGTFHLLYRVSARFVSPAGELSAAQFMNVVVFDSDGEVLHSFVV